MLKITDKIYINEDDVEVRFIRSPGPGGQHVNKVESAVQIRFDANFFQALDMSMFDRLKKLSGQRMNSEGVVIMTANSTRSQIRNREEVMVRLVELLKKAATIPKLRKKTRPTFASKTVKNEKGALKNFEVKKLLNN